MVAVEEKEDKARQEAIGYALETFWLGGSPAQLPNELPSVQGEVNKPIVA